MAVAEPSPLNFQDLNLTALDELVLEYLQQTPQSQETSCSSAAANPTATAPCRIRDWIQQGRIDEALNIINQVMPSILQDLRLLLRMQQQHFVEILRTDGPDATARALEYARDTIVPVALDAYPEAYSEFKQLLLLLVHGQDSPTIPPALASLWDVQQRTHLAEIVYHTACHAAGVTLPKLSLLLRYLCQVYQSFPCSADQEGEEEEREALVEQLLLPGVDKGPMPVESPTLLPPARLPEADVQGLMRGTGLPRQDAVDALRQHDGDRVAALGGLLSRRHFNTDLLDDLAQEYAAYRGLSPCKSQDHSSPVKVDEMEIERGRNPSTTNLPSTEDTSKGGDPECVNEDGAGDPCMDVSSMQNIRSASKSPPHKIARWLEQTSNGASANGTHEEAPGESKEQARNETHKQAGCSGRGEPGSELELSRVLELVQEERWKELIHLIQSYDPELFQQRKSLLFHLYRQLYLQHVARGEVLQALQLARAHLTPLAESYPDLQPLLKDTMSALLPTAKSDPQLSASAPSLSFQLQAALYERRGWSPPRLFSLLHTLLSTHKAWCRKQRCTDAFEEPLRIDVLRQGLGQQPPAGDNPGASAGSTRSAQTLCAPKRGAILSSDSDSDDESRLDEITILHLVEITELPRLNAIQLLMQHNGNIEAVLAHLYGAA